MNFLLGIGPKILKDLDKEEIYKERVSIWMHWLINDLQSLGLRLENLGLNLVEVPSDRFTMGTSLTFINWEHIKVSYWLIEVPSDRFTIGTSLTFINWEHIKVSYWLIEVPSDRFIMGTSLT